MDLQNALNNISKDINEVNEWAESEYSRYFAPYFKGEVELYEKLKSSDDPISDDELEWILTDLPLELFSVTEQLSRLKTAQEVIKLHIKQVEREYVKTSTAESSETKKKEAAAAQTEEDRLLVTIYDQIAERVSRQMTFSKELIMSAKKIWDARRSDGIPLPEVTTTQEAQVDLPDYDIKKNVYVR